MINKTIKKCLVALSIAIAILIGAQSLAIALPAGNYHKSCSRCHMKGHTLVCRNCLNRNNKTRGRTSLSNAHSCKFIENLNGRLACTGGRNKRYNKSRVWIDAGPIMNQADARRRCPRVCRRNYRRWNGQWRTTIRGRASICQCRK